MTLDLDRFVVLLARQRTGTNALQSVLERHPAIDCTREVFHAEPHEHAHLDPERNWFCFLERRGAQDIVRTLTDRDGKPRVFGEFLEHLQGLTPKERIVLDVKLNSTHHLDGPWREPLSDPAMFGILSRNRVPVVHLRRRNHLRAFLSLQAANRTGEWMRSGDAGAEPGPLTLDVGQLRLALERWEAQDAHVTERFPPGERCLQLEYEELFPRLGGGADREQLSRIAEFLGVEDAFDEAEPEYRKQSGRPLRDAIANYDEVAAALDDTEFASCLEDEHAYR